MAMYCVANFAKRKVGDIRGLQDEANRTFDDPSKYKNEVNFEKTSSNIYFAKSDDWRESINEILEEHGIRPRKDAVLFTTSVYGVSKEWEDSLRAKYDSARVDAIKRDYFADCFRFEQSRGKCFSAVVHVDESGNWHMQCATVPIVKHPTKDGQMSLSAKRVFGNIKHMSEEQDRFFEQCGKPYGMERGKCRIDTSEHKKHQTEAEYKLNQDRQRLDEARKDLAQQMADYSAKMDALRRREDDLDEREAEIKRKESLIETRNTQAKEDALQASKKLSGAKLVYDKANETLGEVYDVLGDVRALESDMKSSNDSAKLQRALKFMKTCTLPNSTTTVLASFEAKERLSGHAVKPKHTRAQLATRTNDLYDRIKQKRQHSDDSISY